MTIIIVIDSVVAYEASTTSTQLTIALGGLQRFHDFHFSRRYSPPLLSPSSRLYSWQLPLVEVAIGNLFLLILNWNCSSSSSSSHGSAVTTAIVHGQSSQITVRRTRRRRRSRHLLDSRTAVVAMIIIAATTAANTPHYAAAVAVKIMRHDVSFEPSAAVAGPTRRRA